MALREFTKHELSRYNGRKGAPAYIACQGKVYDLSKSFLWKHGKHQAIHVAGVDLTRCITQAPHGIDLLEKFPVVGILVLER
jgi:predicted heme/steroid binding protein